MLGLRTPYRKHAVVFREYDGASYRFFNPTHEGSGEAAELVLSEAELLASVDRTVLTGRIRSAAPEARSLAPLLKRSVEALRSLTEQYIRSIEKQMEKENRTRSDIYDSFIIR